MNPGPQYAQDQSMEAAAQKETPTTGSNQAAGIQQNDLAIISDRALSISTADYLRDQASASRARLLVKAAAFATGHAPTVLWKRQMKTGPAAVQVRIDSSGSLVVVEVATGLTLAKSVPGQFETLLN